MPLLFHTNTFCPTNLVSCKKLTFPLPNDVINQVVCVSKVFWPQLLIKRVRAIYCALAVHKVILERMFISGCAFTKDLECSQQMLNKCLPVSGVKFLFPLLTFQYWFNDKISQTGSFLIFMPSILGKGIRLMLDIRGSEKLDNPLMVCICFLVLSSTEWKPFIWILPVMALSHLRALLLMNYFLEALLFSQINVHSAKSYKWLLISLCRCLKGKCLPRQNVG